MNRKTLLLLLIVPTLLLSACGPKKMGQMMTPTTFQVTVENISKDSAIPTPLAPGVWVVHSDPYPLYRGGKADMSMGLEALAEDGMPGALYTNLLQMDDVAAVGIFDTPSDMDKPGPLMPGASYSFAIRAMAGDKLSLATMFVQSNDLFFGTVGGGIPLFKGGAAIGGDITAQVLLWDAGTEVNEVPGVGMYQAPRQKGPDMGAPEYGVVEMAKGAFPAVAEMIRVTIKATMHGMDDMKMMDHPSDHN